MKIENLKKDFWKSIKHVVSYDVSSVLKSPLDPNIIYTDTDSVKIDIHKRGKQNG